MQSFEVNNNILSMGVTYEDRRTFGAVPQNDHYGKSNPTDHHHKQEWTALSQTLTPNIEDTLFNHKLLEIFSSCNAHH